MADTARTLKGKSSHDYHQKGILHFIADRSQFFDGWLSGFLFFILSR
jgi:hypothetical protein